MDWVSYVARYVVRWGACGVFLCVIKRQRRFAGLASLSLAMDRSYFARCDLSRGARLGRMFGLLIFGLCLHTPAHAVTNCVATSGLPQALTYPSVIQVNSTLQPGDTIPNTTKPFTITGSCKIGAGSSSTKVQVGSSIVMCDVASSAAEVMSGVYSTGVSGVGMRVRNSSGALLTGASGGSCKSSIGTVQAGGAYSFSGTTELVRTSGTIAAGSVLTSSGVAFAFGVYNTGLLVNVDTGSALSYSELYPSGSITIQNITCNVTYPATVTLPTITASTLASVGAVAGTTPFSIGLNCSNSAKVGITMDAAGASSVDNASAGLITAQGGAKGYDIQILQANRTPMPLQTSVSQGSIVANQKYNYPFFVQYQRVSATTTPGALSGTMVFSFDYQ
jgi:type 1 fimbria pilin